MATALVPLTPQTLRNANEDAVDLGVFVNGTASDTAVNRAGRLLRTLAYYAQRFEQALAAIGYDTPVPYTAGISLTEGNQTVEYEGVVYAPIVSELPFTTSGTFETAKFRVVQGATSQDLTDLMAEIAGPGGSELFGFLQSGAGAVPQTGQMKLYQMPLSPLDYGAVGDGSFDDTDGWTKAVAVARTTGRSLDLRGKSWKLTAKVDMSFLRTVLIDTPLLDARTAGTPADQYLLTFGDPTVDGNNGRSDRLNIVGELNLVCLDERAVPRRGVFIKGAHMNLGHVMANGYNGTGAYVDTLWDSTAGRVMTERCGNVSSSALVMTSNGDTTNCLKIMSIQCELSFGKGLFLNLIRSEVGNIHCEKTYVLTTNDGTAAMQNGATYVNHQLILGNCKIGQAFVDALPANTAIPGGGTTPTGRMNISIYGDDSNIQNWQCPNTDVIVTGGRNLTLSKFNVNSLYQNGPANGSTFNDITAFDRIVVGEGVTLGAPKADVIDMAFNARNVNVFGGQARIVEFTQNIRGNINFYGTQIEALGNTKAAAAFYSQPSFNDCSIQTYYGAFNARAVFRGGLIATATLASQTAADFRGVEFGSFVHNGNPSFITDSACKAFVVTNWSQPTNFAWPAGTITVRLGYTAGAAKHYENRDSNLSWGALTTSPV